ncbi:MAG TPA: ComF family protein [Bacteroidales bacterium]|mgnify:CR=1 FL=1|nr:ComF family protein [Bacteroidales bacterium]HPS63401.1 ComF family protein [Bacteroidales bacterium]
MLYLTDFFSLVFPRICPACGNSLWKNERGICHACEYHLPKTNFHFDAENPVSRLFWGRADIVTAAAFLYFHKGNKVQRLVHQLKYKGRKDIGIFLGEMYGETLKYAPLFNASDVIIPVPLHKKRYMKRGYNQSEQFGIGLGNVMKIPVNRHLLARVKATETQTRKSRFSRYQNVKEIFRVERPEEWENRHLLLVDDVITTGATLESCILALQVIPGVKISVACIATAMI